MLIKKTVLRFQLLQIRNNQIRFYFTIKYIYSMYTIYLEFCRSSVSGEWYLISNWC